jgi:hypothetical protein
MVVAARSASIGACPACAKPQRHESTLFGTRRLHFGQVQLSAAGGASTNQLSARRILKYRRRRGAQPGWCFS